MTMSMSEAGKLGALASREKRIQNKLKRIEEYNKNPIKCKECAAILSYDDKKLKKVFCNSSCGAKYNNTNREKKQYKCLNCEALHNKSANKFCNSICAGEYVRKQNKEEYLSGNKVLSPSSLKKILIDIKGHSCSICKIQEWQGQKVPLVMDHIDGHSENNHIDNMRLVCGNCNMQLPTFTSKNRGNGRASRRKRYQDGLSY